MTCFVFQSSDTINTILNARCTLFSKIKHTICYAVVSKTSLSTLSGINTKGCRNLLLFLGLFTCWHFISWIYNKLWNYMKFGDYVNAPKVIFWMKWEIHKNPPSRSQSHVELHTRGEILNHCLKADNVWEHINLYIDKCRINLDYLPFA
jgi:hypothetical protein